MNLNTLKIYASIQNLYTFTGWDGGDPEQGNRAMTGTDANDDTSYPVPAVYTFGLDISF
jgi:hypothetical protein